MKWGIIEAWNEFSTVIIAGDYGTVQDIVFCLFWGKIDGDILIFKKGSKSY